MNIWGNLNEDERIKILTEVEVNVRIGQPKYDWGDKESFISTSQGLECYE